MILFPNAKINVGLRILRKRPDGYHDLASVFVPVMWCDILEITRAPKDSFRLAGAPLDCADADNIVLKALRVLARETGIKLPPLDIVLEKHIPSGAGLGGGSADAAFALKGVNELLGLGLDEAALAAVAAKVGADCPFFIYNTPALATGIGDVLQPVDASALNGLYVVIVKPGAQSVSTAEAYAGVTPAEIGPEEDLVRAFMLPAECWSRSELIVNDFEPSVFGRRPAIAAAKDAMAAAGALYCAMSGSGAAVFGIFADDAQARAAAASFAGCDVFCQRFSGFKAP